MKIFAEKFKDPKFLLKIFLLVMIYFLTAKFGLSHAYTFKQVTLVWPPTGISLAALFLFDIYLWPGILIGAFLANITSQEPLPTAVLISIGNTLEAVVGYHFLKFFKFKPTFERIKDVLIFFFFAAVLSTTVSATIGTGALIYGGIGSWANYFSIWLTWWGGDLLGNLVVAPAIFVWSQITKYKIRSVDIAEAAGLFVVTVLASLILFTNAFQIVPYSVQVQFKYLIFPVLIWSSYKFKQAGSSFSILVVAAIAVWGAVSGSGPFLVPGNPELTLLYLGVFIAAISFTFMIFSVIIQERDRAAMEVAGKERGFRSLIENSFDAIILIDANAKIIFASPSVTRVTGYTSEELVGINGFDIIYIEDRHASLETLQKVIASPGKTIKLTNRLVLKNKEVHWMEVEGKNLLADPDIGAIVLNFRDVNDRIQLDHVKSEFVSLSAHQLRSPLTTMRWYTESVIKEPALAENLKGYVQEIYKTILGMAETVNMLLDVSRFELGTVNVITKPVDLPALVKKLISDKKNIIATKNINVTYTGVDSVPGFEGDEKLMGVVIENLLSNAIKYTPAAGKITLSLTPKEDKITFQISDNGIGIPGREQNQIFTKLFRASNVKVVEPSGLGLGLYLIKLIVELKGGNIWFKSDEGKGTTFFVEFPMKSKDKRSLAT